jgi:hypothetical protein
MRRREMGRAEWLALFAFVLFWRLTQLHVLWIEEAYPMVGAIEYLHGRIPYREFWFDKPPGAIVFYALFGAAPGWALRIVGSLYVLLCCWLGAKLGGRWTAWLLAAYLSWGVPSAVFALAPDLLMLAPHLAALWFAQRGRAWAAGVASGVAFLIHTKGALVLAAALLWSPDWRMAAAFAAMLPLQFAGGSAYWRQVWEWGGVYSSNSFVASPLTEFGKRTLNWAGFHAAGVLAVQLRASLWTWRYWAWLAIALGSVVLGQRFFPRYYFFLLAPVCVMAGIALEQMRPRTRWIVLSLLLIPALRFGPRNLKLLAGDDSWDDLALFRDSRQIAATVRAQAKPSDTLFVWGYRPDIQALARLSSGTPYIESQPLDCVFADRHLRASVPMQNQGCEERFRNFQRYRPTWFVDGLGPLNPRLRYEPPGYEVVERTNTAVLYRSLDPKQQPQDALILPLHQPAPHPANPAASGLHAAASHPAGR